VSFADCAVVGMTEKVVVLVVVVGGAGLDESPAALASSP